jgi:branched-chain amino acid transport system permease protein
MSWRRSGPLAGLVVLLVVESCVPALMHTNDVYIWTGIVITVVFTVGVCFAVGFAGIAAFGNQVFYGASCYLVGWLILHAVVQNAVLLWVIGFGVSFILGIFNSVLLRAGSGFTFGMVSLAVGQLVYLFAMQSGVVPGGSTGIFGVARPSLFGYSFIGNNGFYFLCVVVLDVALTGLLVFRRSMLGRTVRAIHDSPERAAATGVPVVRYQAVALAVSAGLSGLAGSLFVMWSGGISPDQLNFIQGAQPVLAGLLGGIGTLAGPVVGGAGYSSLSSVLQEVTRGW